MSSVFRCHGILIGVFTLSILSCALSTRADTLSVYLSAPKVESSPYDNTLVETFEELATGVYDRSFRATDSKTGRTFGTFTLPRWGQYAILPDQWGDQQYSAGTGQYLSIGAQSHSSQPLTLHLDTAATYFGFSWNAGDRMNGVTFYNGTTEVGRFTTADVIAKLNENGGTVTAIDGTKYNASDYYGQPSNPWMDHSEPFGFLNFFDLGGVFDTVVFDNSDTTVTGFEMDNLTVFDPDPTPDDSLVFVGNGVVGNNDPPPSSITPEPGATGFMAAMVLSMGGLFFRTKQHRSRK